MTARPRPGMTSQQAETGRDPAAALLDSSWWAPGLALHERQIAARTDAVAEGARERVAAWRAGYGPDGRFDQRLAAAGLDEAALLDLLAESPADLACRVARPAWADTVERALPAAAPRPSDAVDWRAAFALALRPFVADARADLAKRVVLDGCQVDGIADGFADRLSRHLVRIATRALAHELNQGQAGTDRLSDFVRRLTAPAGLAALVTAYPVLARLLGQASRFATDAAVELLTRFAADRTEIVDTLLGGVDPGALVAVRTGLGDAHRRGRSVAVLSFADGRRVVYKPRDLGAHDRFGTLVRWLNQAVPGLDLRTVTAVVRSGYGWLEFIEAGPVPDLDAADRFYRRQGALLVLLHAAHAGDMHYENVIACGEHPVLIDLETLFHATLSASSDAVDPAARMLAESVQRTGLLPVVVVGESGALDVSGLGGDRGQPAPYTVPDWELAETGELRQIQCTITFPGALNRPRLGKREIDAADHERALLDGFRLAYDAVLRHRSAVLDLLDACADIEVRVAVRHSRGYATLLAESTRPELLRDALDRDRALDLLWTESAHHPAHWRLVRHEQADLWAHDVPLFTARPGSADLWTSAGQRLPDLLDRPGLHSAVAKVRAMSEVDRRDQEWIISAALATRRPAGEHRGAGPVPEPLAGTAAPPERLLAAACALADQIVARTLAEGDRVNWLGLELVDDRQWMVLPMGAGLANGYVGVALFLAQLTELSGIARYGEVARRALSAVPRMFAPLAARPDLVAAVGCGGFHGFGGIAYGLARLTTLLADDELRGWTRTAVELATTAASAPGQPGLATGYAGCLATMTAVHAELGLPEAARLAQGCADGLAELVVGAHGALAPTPGFADGTAGIGWALGRYATSGGGPRHAEAARLALAGALSAGTENAGHGWCAGTAGLAMARAGSPDLVADDPATRLLDDRPVLRDLSLCHGELGIAEAMITPTATDAGAERMAAARRRRACLILDAINHYGAPCGPPGGVSTPGLLTGLAGIGYGLLRLGFAERVPSVLLLEPSRSTAA
ncbi:type 2 lanthipeptide synthetase LanM family protein [Actinokineospora sp.]|uniref:type 2 lanthipeptide synthetase LanM family protein n=1 Tax=Actinokineospora sp. TaxID=1872133 RepID=UPI004037A5B9